MLCFLVKNPPMEIGKIIRIYVAQGILINARLGFGGPSLVFPEGKKLNFRQNFRQDSELVTYYSATGRNIENLKLLKYGKSKSKLTI